MARSSFYLDQLMYNWLGNKMGVQDKEKQKN